VGFEEGGNRVATRGGGRPGIKIKPGL